MWNFVGIAGTLIELVGFVLLSLDLLPEYRLYQDRRGLHGMTNVLKSASWVKQREERKNIVEDGGNNSLRGGLIDLSMNLETSPYSRLLRNIDVDFSKLNAMDDDGLAALIGRAGEYLHQKERNHEARWRPPIRLGIFVVVAGVFIQIIGQLPGFVRCPLLRDTIAAQTACEGVEIVHH